MAAAAADSAELAVKVEAAAGEPAADEPDVTNAAAAEPIAAAAAGAELAAGEGAPAAPAPVAAGMLAQSRAGQLEESKPKRWQLPQAADVAESPATAAVPAHQQPAPPAGLLSLLQEAVGHAVAVASGLTAELVGTFEPLLDSLGDREVSCCGLVVAVGWPMPHCCCDCWTLCHMCPDGSCRCCSHTHLNFRRPNQTPHLPVCCAGGRPRSAAAPPPLRRSGRLHHSMGCCPPACGSAACRRRPR